MSTIPESNGRIGLVTGISGFIGAWVGLAVLQGGYTLRGTVRRPESIKLLLDGRYKPYVDAGRVQIITIPDMTAPGCFDEAVAGVDHIHHVASPVTFADVPLKEYIDPAVAMVREMLESAIGHAGPQLRSLTLTSSVAAVQTTGVLRHYTTSDWNDFAMEQCAKEGDATNGNLKYSASKVVAERYLWRFREERKPKFGISAVHPAVVSGPPLFLPQTADSFSVSTALLWQVWAGEEIPAGIGGGCFIDVRDVAEMHIWTANHSQQADGNRYLTAAGTANPQAAADLLHEWFPERSGIMKRGTPGEGYKKDYGFLENGQSYDITLPMEALGDMVGFKESLSDMITVFKKFMA